MSKLYHYLEFENFQNLSEKIYQYLVNKTNILETKYPWNSLNKQDVLKAIPEIELELEKIIPSRIVLIAIFYSPPGFAGGVHIDAGDFKYRFLMPVYNCEKSYTKFFDVNGNNLIELISGESDPYYLVEEKNPLIEIGSAETIAPLILDVKAPHGIFNNPDSTEPRLTLTIGFDDEDFLCQLMQGS